MTSAAIVLVGVALVAVGIAFVAVHVRRQTGYAVLRTLDRPTRKAVQRAIRTGRADDPRIAESARAVAAATPRQRWAPWLYAALMALQAVVLTQRIVDREPRAVLSAVFLALFGFAWVTHRRWQRGLDRFRVSAGSSSGSHPSS